MEKFDWIQALIQGLEEEQKKKENKRGSVSHSVQERAPESAGSIPLNVNLGEACPK